MQRKMKRLSEEEIKKFLADEYKYLYERHCRSKERLEKGINLSDDHKDFLRQSMEQDWHSMKEIVRVWKGLFDEEYLEAVLAILDRIS